MFPCFSRCLGRRCLTKFHINPASKKLPPTGLKCLLRRRMLCRFTSINGHLRGGDTVIGDDYCSISASKIAAPLSCTYLLFIDPSSVLCFSMFFTHIQTLWSSVGIVGHEGLLMNMYMAHVCTCTDQVVPVETSVQSYPILYELRDVHITNLPTCQKKLFPSLEVDDPSDK